MKRVLPLARVLRVARIHLTAWPTAFGWPLAILAVAFTINVALFASIGDSIGGVGPIVTGGIASIYLVQFIASWQAITQTFSFAVGLNVTRRTYYAATALVAVAQSLAFGVLLYLLGQVEQATHGWGIRLAFYDLVPATHGHSPLQFLVYAGPMILMSMLGLFLGTVAKRWGANGVFGFSVLAIVALGLAGIVVDRWHGWPTVLHWVVAPSVGELAGWVLVPVVLLAAAAYRLLRRAVP